MKYTEHFKRQHLSTESGSVTPIENVYLDEPSADLIFVSNKRSKAKGRFNWAICFDEGQQMGLFNRYRNHITLQRAFAKTAIKDKTTIAEGELLTTYFDPILANILANPDENVLLRWANVTCDATISKLTQMTFGPSLGFGEAKVVQPTCDKYMLCYDLARLATFAKDTIAENKLNASLSVTLFLARLRHDGIYVMQEIAYMTFPQSIEELVTFISKITDAFWRLRTSCDNEELIKAHGRPTNPSLYSLVDASEDRRRLCSLRFGS
ncbi:hypothetical protein BCV72DRAFT_339594 [Rhizopus microsporus var. microsporus]|uniref:Uncharacterized protein n=1 Tax=Rhizopus microsporus var. microsporus TaxID=86635 RepID=A0A1X0QN69_RHIZD|nr:hypothetical protein BCV72DRAFT_339594 [Rhizopus microsporus var. microsporus]